MRVILKTQGTSEYLDIDDLQDIAEIIKHQGKNIEVSLPDEEDEEGCELVLETVGEGETRK